MGWRWNIIDSIIDYISKLTTPDLVAFFALLVAIFSFIVSKNAGRNSLLASDGPRIVVTNQKIKSEFDRENDIYTVNYKNLGKGLAIRVFLLNKTKVRFGKNMYFLSLPNSNVQPLEEKEIKVEIRRKQSFKPYLISMDFFGNLHVTHPYDMSNEHLKYLKNFNKSYSRTSLGRYLFKYYMYKARKQKNTSVDVFQNTLKMASDKRNKQG